MSVTRRKERHHIRNLLLCPAIAYATRELQIQLDRRKTPGGPYSRRDYFKFQYEMIELDNAFCIVLMFCLPVLYGFFCALRRVVQLFH